MKIFLFLLLESICVLYVGGQKRTYTKIHGDTYVIAMIKGWETSLDEKMYKGPAPRRIAGYETTHTTRIRLYVSSNDI